MNYIDSKAVGVHGDNLGRPWVSTRETRAESHVKVLLTPGTLNHRIVHWLSLVRRGWTRTQLAMALSARESSLCGRLNELVKAGLVFVGPTEYNKLSMRNVVTYWVIPEPVLSQDGNVRRAGLRPGADWQVGVVGFGINDAEALANYRKAYMERYHEAPVQSAD